MAINGQCAGQMGHPGETQAPNMFCLSQAMLACEMLHLCVCVFKLVTNI